MLLENGQVGDYLKCFISFAGIESAGLKAAPMESGGHKWKICS